MEYSTQKVSKGILSIIPQSVFSSNIYIIDEKLVIDTGTKMFGCFIADVLKKLSLSPENVVLTHMHWDHVGGANNFHKLFGCKILIHKNDFKIICSHPEWSMHKLFGESFEMPIISRVLEKGEELKTKNYIFKVLHTPGHTPGSICLYDEKKGVLISGDTFFGFCIGRTDLPGGSEKDLFNSLKTLSSLSIELLLPGHGEPVKGKISQLIRKFLER